LNEEMKFENGKSLNVATLAKPIWSAKAGFPYLAAPALKQSNPGVRVGG